MSWGKYSSFHHERTFCEKYNLDQAYAKIGSGTMQTILTFVNAIARNSGAFFIYPFAYLVLEQKFKCSRDDWASSYACEASEICVARSSGAPLLHEVDTSY